MLPDGAKKKSKVMALSGHFDLPARAGVTEQVTYIGHDSCCYCDEHGEVIKTGQRGHVMTFPFRNTVSGHARPRTAEEVKTNSFNALEMNKTIRSFTLDFYEAIVDSALSLINYHLIEISSSYLLLLLISSSKNET